MRVTRYAYNIFSILSGAINISMLYNQIYQSQKKLLNKYVCVEQTCIIAFNSTFYQRVSWH
jgi:hypothetical protein